MSARPPTIGAKLAAEAIGTFMITAVAAGVDAMYYSGERVDDVSRWLARGFIAAVVIYAFGETSGAHADPAVTIGFMLRRVFPLGLGVAYIVAQFVGAFLAATLYLKFVGSSLLAVSSSHPGIHFSQLEAAVAETILTFALMLVILMTAQEQAVVGKQAALAVGLTISTCGFVAGAISGASMNPARTIAPEILSGSLANVWIYAVGPVLGAALAVAVHALLCGPPNPEEHKVAKGN